MFVFTLLAILLVAVYGLLIAYYRAAWRAIPVFSPGGGLPPSRTRISVIVPARNEEDNIGACLDSLALQTYPSELFEVIVIDDHSTDRTGAIAKAFAAKGRIRCLGAADMTGMGEGKKKGIEAGIKASTGDLIVTTDADCRPQPDWLRTMAAFYEESGAKFIAAPVRIGGRDDGGGNAGGPKRGHGFLSIFQTLDFIVLQGITGAAVYRRFHSMCNGANLAYEKNAFIEVGGFSGIDTIPSGDDMLLMHKIFLRYPGQVFFLKSRQAIVDTGAEERWEGFVNQRVRWASKAGHYDDKRIFWVLLLVYVVNALFLGLAVAGCWNRWWWWVALLLGLVKTLVEYPFVRSVAVFFGQQRLLLYFAWLQPLHILYTLVIGWLGQFGHYRWKGRKISTS